jgi:hypothetical protein
LNRESLYMIPLLVWFAALLERVAVSANQLKGP